MFVFRSKFMFLSAPLVVNVCVRTAFSYLGGARHFPTRRHQFRCAWFDDRFLVSPAARGKVRGLGRSGAVGVFTKGIAHAFTVGPLHAPRIPHSQGIARCLCEVLPA